jgi:hypothetical protein
MTDCKMEQVKSGLRPGLESLDINAGGLVTVLQAYNPGDVEKVYVVYVGHGDRRRRGPLSISWSTNRS